MIVWRATSSIVSPAGSRPRRIPVRQQTRGPDQIVRTLRDGAPAGGGVEAPPGLAALGLLIDDHARTGLSVRLRRRPVLMS